jgi:genome maintenance exonuclease 1
MFNLKLFEKYNLSEVYENNKRFYITPDGDKFKSVTTIISEHFGTEYLDKWRNRVGIEEANRISNIAKTRGSAIHNICEKYLLGDLNYKNKHMPGTIFTFNQIKHILDENIKNIYGIEFPLYSKNLKTAGRADLISDFSGNLSIVDFKTSKRIKQETSILNYFIQATCYAYMANYLLNININQIVIIIAVDDDHPQIFIKKISDYQNTMLKIFT